MNIEEVDFIVQSHEECAQRITGEPEPSAKQVEDLVKRPPGLVDHQNNRASIQLANAVSTAAKEFPKILSPEYQAYLTAARNKASNTSTLFIQVIGL